MDRRADLGYDTLTAQTRIDDAKHPSGARSAGIFYAKVVSNNSRSKFQIIRAATASVRSVGVNTFPAHKSPGMI
jgi:hypothetical protein